MHQARNTNTRLPRVVIVGAGFGGLYAARALANCPVRVTVIDRVNYHTFQPLLYQVAVGVLSPGEIAQPIRRILSRARNIDVVMARVDTFDLDKRRVLAQGTPIEYDYLVVAAGSRHAYFGHDEWEPDAPGLKTIDDAIAIRGRILNTFEEQERRACLGERGGAIHFAVIGGGTTGVELAGAIADIATRALGRDYKRINTSQTRITVFEGSPRILRDYPEDLSRKATEELKELGVEVRTGNMVTGVRSGAIQVRGEWIPVNAALWASGVAVSPLGRLLAPGHIDKSGRIAVNGDLSLPGRPEVFVIGDQASLVDAAGKKVPALAAVATQEGRAAADNIMRVVQGKKRKPFRYKDRGMLATIGRNRAVAVIYGRHLSGLPAWLLWAFVHIFLLIGFRNRIAVFSEWIWAYFTRQRSSLLITGNADE